MKLNRQNLRNLILEQLTDLLALQMLAGSAMRNPKGSEAKKLKAALEKMKKTSEDEYNEAIKDEVVKRAMKKMGLS